MCFYVYCFSALCDGGVVGLVRFLVISTVGTSLLLNYSRKIGVGMDELRFDSEFVGKLVGFIRDVGEEFASSETNSLSRIIRDLGDVPHVILLCSDTIQCKLCGRAVTDYYRGMGVTVEFDVVENLKYDEKKFESEGLRNLVNKVIGYVRHGVDNGYRVVINATPGFKAESAILTVIAMLYKLDVYYIHEKFRDLIRIPHIPLRFDLEKWSRWKYAMNDLRKWVSKDAFVKKYGMELYRDLEPLIEEENNEIRLGPIGFAYYMAALDYEEKQGEEIS